ncbi:MAG TPA: hypothetical protein VN943_20095 [Candidatus Acidoferrum sp.]|nr:hypothetical protein [Candidatus Acidoferrum sp.]
MKAENCQPFAQSVFGDPAEGHKLLQSGVDLPYRAIKTNIGDSLNVVVHLERRPGRRFVSEVVEIHGYDPDKDEYNYGLIFADHKEFL